MILDTDEQTLKRPFDQLLSNKLLKELGCVVLEYTECITKIINLRIVRDTMIKEHNRYNLNVKILEQLNRDLIQLSDPRYPYIWKFNYKGQEIFFNSSTYTDHDDYTGYEIGQVTEVVLHTDGDIYVRSLQDFLNGLEKVVEYQIKQSKSFIIKKSNNGKTYQQSIQRNLLRKQRLPQFQTRARSYRTPRLFRDRNR